MFGWMNMSVHIPIRCSWQIDEKVDFNYEYESLHLRGKHWFYTDACFFVAL